MKALVTRTHHLGKKLRRSDWQPPTPGAIEMLWHWHPELNRNIGALTLKSLTFDNPNPPRVPDLQDPQLLTFGSTMAAMMIIGFEEIDQCRYYQGWYIHLE